MAKHGRRRRKYRKYLKGIIDERGALSTLAGDTAISFVVTGTVTEKAWLSSVKLNWAMDDFTPGTDDGPILVGVAHSDYSTSEIEAWIENSGGWSEGDLVAQEIAKRKIRQVGVFENPSAAVDVAVLNDGKPITTKCGWMLETGDTVRYWAYNTGTSALATTDPNLKINGHANLWPA